MELKDTPPRPPVLCGPWVGFLGLFVAFERTVIFDVFVCVCLGESEHGENHSFSTVTSQSSFLPP